MSHNPSQARNAKGSPMAGAWRADNQRGAAAATSPAGRSQRQQPADNGFSQAAHELEEHTLATWVEHGHEGDEMMRMVALGDDMIAVETVKGAAGSEYFTITPAAADSIAEDHREEVLSEGRLDDDTFFLAEQSALHRRGVWYEATPVEAGHGAFDRRAAVAELVSHAATTLRMEPGLETATRVHMNWEPDENLNDMPCVDSVELADGSRLDRSHPSVHALDQGPAGAMLRSSLFATGEELFDLPEDRAEGSPEDSYRRLGRALVLEHRDGTRRLRSGMQHEHPDAASIQYGWEALVSTSRSYVPVAVLDERGGVLLDGNSESWPEFEESAAYEYAKDIAEDRQFQLRVLDFT